MESCDVTCEKASTLPPTNLLSCLLFISYFQQKAIFHSPSLAYGFNIQPKHPWAMVPTGQPPFLAFSLSRVPPQTHSGCDTPRGLIQRARRQTCFHHVYTNTNTLPHNHSLAHRTLHLSYSILVKKVPC